MKPICYAAFKQQNWCSKNKSGVGKLTCEDPKIRDEISILGPGNREFLHDLQQMLSVTLKRSPVSVDKIDNNTFFFPSLSRELHVNNLETIAANVFYEIPELLHL